MGLAAASSALSFTANYSSSYYCVGSSKCHLIVVLIFLNHCGNCLVALISFCSHPCIIGIVNVKKAGWDINSMSRNDRKLLLFILWLCECLFLVDFLDLQEYVALLQ